MSRLAEDGTIALTYQMTNQPEADRLYEELKKILSPQWSPVTSSGAVSGQEKTSLRVTAVRLRLRISSSSCAYVCVTGGRLAWARMICCG